MAIKVKKRDPLTRMMDNTAFMRYLKSPEARNRFLAIPGLELDKIPAIKRLREKRLKEMQETYKDKNRVRDARKKFDKDKKKIKKKAGGRVKKVKAHRGDGIAKRGRTRGRIV